MFAQLEAILLSRFLAIKDSALNAFDLDD